MSAAVQSVPTLLRQVNHGMKIMDKIFLDSCKEWCALDDMLFPGDDGIEFVGKITNKDTLLLMEKIKCILEANEDG